MIIDCFMFFNELDLLEIRLQELKNVVDVFCLSESTHTHSGNEKELVFQENKNRFSEFNIRSLVVSDLLSKNRSWAREKYQRDILLSMLDEYDDDDIVLVSDLDEIPCGDDISRLEEMLKKYNRVVFNHRMFSYYLNGYENTSWAGSIATKLGELRRNSLSFDNLKFRSSHQWNSGSIDSGWHFSYVASPEKIAYKIQSYAHTEYDNPDIVNVENVKRRIEKGDNVLGKNARRVDFLSIDNSWPTYVFENQDKFSHLIRMPNNTEEKNERRLVVSFDAGKLTERGTTVALYDYAHFNEKILGNKSVVLIENSSEGDKYTKIRDQFLSRFEYVFFYDKIGDFDSYLKEMNVDVAYWLCRGKNDGRCSRVVKRNVTHAVFPTSKLDIHNDVYAYVSEWLSINFCDGEIPFVPHIVHLEKYEGDMRESLGIPRDAVVIGRHGGTDSFDIAFARDVVHEVVERRDDLFMIFVNTGGLIIDHPRVIYLDVIEEEKDKCLFINTCDAYLHARERGETFGLAIGEFSYFNKPVISYSKSPEKHHFKVLENSIISYDSRESLFGILMDFQPEPGDYGGYRIFSPENVMKKFEEVFFSGIDEIRDISRVSEDVVLNETKEKIVGKKFRMINLNHHSETILTFDDEKTCSAWRHSNHPYSVAEDGSVSVRYTVGNKSVDKLRFDDSFTSFSGESNFGWKLKGSFLDDGDQLEFSKKVKLHQKFPIEFFVDTEADLTLQGNILCTNSVVDSYKISGGFAYSELLAVALRKVHAKKFTEKIVEKDVCFLSVPMKIDFRDDEYHLIWDKWKKSWYMDKKYVGLIESGVEFPPIMLAHSSVYKGSTSDISKNQLLFVDGSQRLMAHLEAGKDVIQTYIMVDRDVLHHFLSDEDKSSLQSLNGQTTWFPQYQQIREVGLRGERGQVDRFSEVYDLSEVKGHVVVDFGCNIGQACVESAFCGAQRVYGFEFQKEAVSVAQKINEILGLNINYNQFDFNKSSFKEDVISVVDSWDYACYLAVFRTKELKDAKANFEFIVRNTKKAIFFEGHADPKIDTIDFYQDLFREFNVKKFEYLGHSNDRPAFRLEMR